MTVGRDGAGTKHAARAHGEGWAVGTRVPSRARIVLSPTPGFQGYLSIIPGFKTTATRNAGPVSSPDGWHPSSASPPKHLPVQSVALRAKKPLELILAAKGLAAALPTGNFLNSEALEVQGKECL